MAYIQLVSPNLDPFIKEGGVVLSDWLGWCLAYAKTAYSAFGATGDTAWKAWNATKFKHTDELPVGVYVPIWFSGYGGLGHVSIFYKRPDGQVQIWSSPISHKPYADVWGSIGEIERRYGVKYVGWSEDIAGVQVIKQGDTAVKIGNSDDWYWRFNRLHHQLVRNHDMGREVFNSIVGQDAWTIVESWSDHSDADVLIQYQVVGEKATAENWQGQITTLTSDNAKLTKENEILKAQVGDATKWQTLKALLKELFN